MKGYRELQFGDFGPSFVRKDRLSDLNEVQAIIFDCDGVLIDVGDFYASAVKETVTALSRAYMDVEIPSELIDRELIYRFKRTGGFNNDWALSYAIQMYLFSQLCEDEIAEIRENAEKAMSISEADLRFNNLYSMEKQFNIDLNDLRSGLASFTEELDASGPVSVDNKLLKKVGSELKMSLGYPGEVGSGMIPTLFEYIFGGRELFSMSFGFNPKFNVPISGLLEKGALIVTSETFEALASLLGGNKFGIASGSLERTAKYVLGGFSDYFLEEAEIWMNDVNRVMSEKGIDGLRKPNPFSLLEAAKALEPFRKVLYVGDSMADLIMSEKAKTRDDRYVFAGVYQHVHPSDESMKGFIKGGSDIVTPSVNQLPDILDWIRGV